ncbi:dual specificity phosphatase 12 [Coelomomyces lativittatus]|nr:dual specificity phosphatase 12 [Coelomomyces lativittatus]KAJ1502576.1 dual specificity phosphatase 12 [Coelomomyces lativittatus]KAJ1509333.1 dual specificity phosphatase 12 [Coelomomyces lativittatus]
MESQSSKSIIYRCPKCRQYLFSDSDIIEHEVHSFTKKSHSRFKASSMPTHCCSVYNVSPKPWMHEELSHQSISGKILCSHIMKNGTACGLKLGEYHWQGSTCSCGKWMSPAFFIPKSKVDQIKQDSHLTLPLSM